MPLSQAKKTSAVRVRPPAPSNHPPRVAPTSPRRALLLRSAVLLGYARCGSSSNIRLPSSIPALARTRSNFVVVASSSLMVASRLVWIWPRRFTMAIVLLRWGGGFELFGRVEYRPRVVNSGALLLLGSIPFHGRGSVAANGIAIWPRPALALCVSFWAVGLLVADNFQSCIARMC